MLKISAYTVSNENLDETIPSPLVEGDVAAIPEAIVEYAPAELQPIEQAVELPAYLDPTPVEPLSSDIIQEEVIAENLETEAGQLMGASIALEGYTQLLRASGKNMTRQSAAFMAVGMRRANRLIPGASLGMEDESSGTQVMAMQQAKVDEKGLGDKLKTVGEKVWAWLKEQYAKLKELWAKAKAFFNKDKEKAVYLLAAASAVQSGDPSKVKGLEAPKGLRSAQVLDAIHGKDKREPVKTVQIPAALAMYVMQGGKFGLVAKNGQDAQLEYITAATAFTKAVNSYISSLNGDEGADEVTAHVEGLLKQHMNKPKTYKVMGGFTIERTAEGVLEINDPDVGDSSVEIPLPSMDEIVAYLKTVGDANAADKAFDDYLDAGSGLMSNKSFAKPEVKALVPALVSVFRGSGVDASVQAINSYVVKSTSRAVSACDFLIAAHAGVSGTVSQEDYVRMPSRGLSVVAQPAGPGLGSRIAAGAKEAWRKAKEFFIRLWQQFRDGVNKLWERIFGEEKKVDLLLLANEAIPEEGAPATGTPLALPAGSGLKSVTAANTLSGPTAQSAAPVVDAVVETNGAVPKGFIYTDSLKKLKLSSGYAFEPTIEENLIAWFNASYNPAVVKMWRDVTSMANSNFDVAAFDTWGKVLTEMATKVMSGAPVGEIPGGQSLVLNEGTIAFSFGGGNGTESEPVKALNKRQVAQILARQKRAFRGLELAQKATEDQNRLHEQFSQVIERLVNGSDDAKAAQYSAFYTTVNRLMCNTAVRQLATTVGSRFAARNDVMDEMIAARAKRN